MSHIVSIQTEIGDPAAIRLACDRLKLPEPVFGKHKLFSSSVTGWAVRLPEWKYPVVCEVNTAQVAYDNYGGAGESRSNLTGSFNGMRLRRQLWKRERWGIRSSSNRWKMARSS